MACKSRNRLNTSEEVCPGIIARIEINMQHASNSDLLRRSNTKVAQDNEQGGRGIRGDQVNSDGRIVIDVTVAKRGCDCDPTLLPDNGMCFPRVGSETFTN
jgi:hypothetical protein